MHPDAHDEVLGLAADTEEHAHDAIRAVKIGYEQMPFLVTEDDALKAKFGTLGGNSNVSNPREDATVGRVLNAAALTYVAATLTSILSLLYYLHRFGVLGGGRD